jgi:microcystin degradation protein MlrC
MLADLAAAGRLDGVLLDLHGAMVPEGLDDGEGDLMAAVRRIIGPAVPMAVTLDLHGNLTAAMVESTELLHGYKTYPHVDMAERGRGDRAAARVMKAHPPDAALGRRSCRRSAAGDGARPMHRLYDLADDGARPGSSRSPCCGFPSRHPPAGSPCTSSRTTTGRSRTAGRELAGRLWAVARHGGGGVIAGGHGRQHRRQRRATAPSFAELCGCPAPDRGPDL